LFIQETIKQKNGTTTITETALKVGEKNELNDI
jgi:hypothetical protein